MQYFLWLLIWNHLQTTGLFGQTCWSTLFNRPTNICKPIYPLFFKGSLSFSVVLLQYHNHLPHPETQGYYLSQNIGNLWDEILWQNIERNIRLHCRWPLVRLTAFLTIAMRIQLWLCYTVFTINEIYKWNITFEHLHKYKIISPIIPLSVIITGSHNSM